MRPKGVLRPKGGVLRPKGGLSAERGLAVKYRKAEVVATATERAFRPKDAAEIVSVRLTVVL